MTTEKQRRLRAALIAIDELVLEARIAERDQRMALKSAQERLQETFALLKAEAA